ncbi:DNA polymerase III subunit gamma/tau [Patescibacteria group bacterium]|nr:DNA polymerase III subunit gamma/tau [Patescibacteria group bacterium]
MSQALYRKYRPSRFDTVSGQGHIVQTIQNEIKDGTIAHAYLFSGPRGVGKTTIARLLAKTINCDGRKKDSAEPCGDCSHCKSFDENSAMDIIEIDAASHTGVDNVRENIIEALRFAPVSGKYKIFIIDEVHMLSTNAFNALLKTLEEPPAYGIFILATTEIHKIPQTIISRCQRFDFHRLSQEEIIKRLSMVINAEGITADDSVLESIARLSEGCLRDAESLLGQILALGEKDISQELASIILPLTNAKTINLILEACDALNAKPGLLELISFVQSGGSIKHLNDDLIEQCRENMMLALENNIGLAKKYNWYLEVFLKARVTSAPESIPQLPLEMAIIEICSSQSQASVDSGRQEEGRVLETKPEPQKHEVQKNEQIASVEQAQPKQKAVFSIEDLKAKWNRCVEEAGKVNMALPLVLQHGVPIETSSDGVIIGFERSFHFDTMNQPKNLGILSGAIERVMQGSVNVFVKQIEAKKEKPLQNLVDAFGGLVVE